MTGNMTQTNNEREALLDKLLAEYWDIAYSEGNSGLWHGKKAQSTLNDIRKLFKTQSPVSQNEQQEPFGYFKAEPFGWTDCAETDEGAIPLYESPPKQAIPDITVETKLPFDIYFGKGKVGKGCTFSTLIKRISAQSSFVDELISENEELRKKLGIPSKRELFNKMLNAAPTNTEVGE